MFSRSHRTRSRWKPVDRAGSRWIALDRAGSDRAPLVPRVRPHLLCVPRASVLSRAPGAGLATSCVRQRAFSCTVQLYDGETERVSCDGRMRHPSPGTQRPQRAISLRGQGIHTSPSDVCADGLRSCS
eukprot:3193553-Prymnesium_polylepis.1